VNILSVKGIDVCYGESEVCHALDIDVKANEIVCILGRNGVGKTTLLRSIIGLTPPRCGQILFEGKDIANLRPFKIARLGIGYVPQGRHILSDLTVAENLRSGTVLKYGKFGPIAEEVFEYFPILKERLTQKGGTLSGGEQQMLAIGRSLAGDPKLLLLDEPSEGIQPSIVQKIRDIIRQLNQEKGLTILLVEQNLKFALALGHRGYIMEKGYIKAEGDMGKLAEDEIIREHLTFSAKGSDAQYGTR
jgi:urea ABC transporter ATP-binding protein UrtE